MLWQLAISIKIMFIYSLESGKGVEMEQMLLFLISLLKKIKKNLLARILGILLSDNQIQSCNLLDNNND